jgi:hypothetical protein
MPRRRISKSEFRDAEATFGRRMSSAYIDSAIEYYTLQNLLRKPNTFTFNYSDLITGQSYVKFYLGAGYNDTGANEWILFPSTFKTTSPTLVSDTSTGVLGDYVQLLDQDVDVLVNYPMAVQGKAIFEFTLNVRMTASGSGSSYGRSYAQVRLRKYDGSTETEIGVARGAVIQEGVNSGSSPETNSYRYTYVMECTKTFLKPGDYLRLTIEYWGYMYQSPGASPQIYGWIDTDPEGTTFESQIPFRISTDLN